MVFKGKKTFRSAQKFKSGNKALPGSLERLQYLQELLTEYQETSISEYKEQILANLANFCYDSRNGPHLRQLHLVDLFLDCIKQPSTVWFKAASQPNSDLKIDEHTTRLSEFALGGLCNLAASSPLLRQDILNHTYLPCIVACTTSPDNLIVVYSLTILIHLFTRCPNSPEESISLGSRFPAAVQIARHYCESSGPHAEIDPRIRTLAQILLEDCCTTTTTTTTSH
ncbi:unnamed protein product [Trichobilharzia szidati]|nr:unnamed protein product [Trichobilharzia szidati]